MPLAKYFEEKIFNPLGIKRTSFRSTAETRSQMASMHERNDSGNVVPRAHLLKAAREDLPTEAFDSGGAGLISNADDYCRKQSLHDLLISVSYDRG